MTQTEQTGLISLIHDLTITGMPLDTVLSLIPRHLEMNDPRLNSDINELVTYIYYSSPQWIYKGHTYYELNPDKIPTDSVLAAPQPIVRKQKSTVMHLAHADPARNTSTVALSRKSRTGQASPRELKA